jgi:hypothetical protein
MRPHKVVPLILQCFTVFVFALCLFSVDGQEKIPTVNPWQTIDSVTMQADIFCEWSDEFLKINDKPDIRKVNKRTEHVVVNTQPNRYSIEETTTYADKSNEGVREMAYDGEYTCILKGSVDRFIDITKSKATDLSTSYFGYDALFFPYNFLFEAHNAGALVWEDLGDIRDPKVWQEKVLSQQPTVYIDQNFGRLCLFQIKRATYTDKVSLAPDFHNLPIYYSRTSDGGNKIIDYYAINVDKIQNKESYLYYPSKAKVIFYSSDTPDFKLVTYTQTINKIAINKKLPDDVFQIDPSMANYIWDSDKQQLIKIPR